MYRDYAWIRTLSQSGFKNFSEKNKALNMNSLKTLTNIGDT